MSVKYLLLGGLMKEPLHGYMLKYAHFDQILKAFGINDGQLYPALKKLEKENLIVKEIIHQEGAPSKHIYTITDKGRAEFIKWLRHGGKEEVSARYDFLRKDPFLSRSVFLTCLKKEDAAEIVDAWIRITEKQIDVSLFALENLKTAGLSGWKAKILEYGILQDRVKLKWLGEFLQELEKLSEFDNYE